MPRGEGLFSMGHVADIVYDTLSPETEDLIKQIIGDGAEDAMPLIGLAVRLYKEAPDDDDWRKGTLPRLHEFKKHLDAFLKMVEVLRQGDLLRFFGEIPKGKVKNPHHQLIDAIVFFDKPDTWRNLRIISAFLEAHLPPKRGNPPFGPKKPSQLLVEGLAFALTEKVPDRAYRKTVAELIDMLRRQEAIKVDTDLRPYVESLEVDSKTHKLLK